MHIYDDVDENVTGKSNETTTTKENNLENYFGSVCTWFVQ